MAKKKQELTVEEKLAEALVREEDWPYVVPGNWVWVRLGSVAEFERGITFPASAKNSMPGADLLPCIRTANIQESLELEDLLYVNRSYVRGNSNKYVLQNDIIMSTANSRELVGKVSFVSEVLEEMTFGGFVLTIRAKHMLSRFLYFYLRFQFISGKFLSESTQTTNIANIKVGTLNEYTFPLPPLAEQQRIVDRIESLFDKLDQAKDLIQAALDSFEIRKAAILHQAFTGQLTKKWREAHGVGMESWEDVNLGDVVNGFKYGTSEKSDYTYKGIPVLRIPNILNDGLIDSTDLKYLAENSQIDKYSLQEGDVLIIRSNGSRDLVGKSAMVYESEIGYAYASYLIRMRPTKIIPRYLVTLMNSSIIRDQMFKKAKSSAGINNINTKELASLKFKLPSRTEQQEIVRILDDLFAKEQNAKDLCDLIDQIEAMKKTILGQAFRGELGTNVVWEASEVELLKESILSK